ncbi:MAG: hypothetical protein Q8P67_04285, partial [archaeon]|nr:hypothetical protein [archaeon]
MSSQQTRQSAEALAAKQKGPLAYYDFLAANGEIRLDPHQRVALQPLQNLHDKLISSGPLYLDPPSSSSSSNSNRSNSSIGLMKILKGFFGAGEPVESARENVREMPREGWPKGLYMFGDVGCGKTFLMDLFFECCP